MAGSVNKVILIGNLGADPEVRQAQDGTLIVNLRLATSENWRDKNSGERRERTEWHRVVIFNENLARVAQQYLRKGAKVYLEGQLQTRKWTDKDNIERYSTEVVIPRFRGELTMLDGRAGAGGAGAASGDDYGDDYGAPAASAMSGSAMSGSGGAGHGAGHGGGRASGGPSGGQRAYSPPPSDLDDEIPF